MRTTTNTCTSAATPAARIRAWELPLRVFHWGLVAAFAGAWLTTGDRYLDVHLLAGYSVAGLVAFRLLWGYIGETHARFRSFRFGWQQVRRHLSGVLRGRPAHFTGHNPAGSWAIRLMLSLLALLVVSGLLTLGAEERHGPLAGWAGIATGVVMHDIHRVAAWSMLAVVALHVIGVLAESLLQRQNLVRSMLTGFKRAESGTSVANRRAVGALMIVAAGLFGAWWGRGYVMQTPDRPYLPFVGAQLPDDPLWREECGACHLAYHPSLLPARSWQRVMDEQSGHFGEDLALDATTVKRIGEFLLTNSAQYSSTEAAWKINRSIAPDAVLLRITDAPYWESKHRDIDAAVWKQNNVNGRFACDACHRDAQQGAFEDAAMRVPPPAPTQR